MAELSVVEAHEAMTDGRAAEAFRAMKAWAERGDVRACFTLGVMYDDGIGTRRSRSRAAAWYTRAYELGDSLAAMNLAVLCRDAGDAKQEFAWYRRAAELGDGDALVEVAIRYLSGKGVRRDLAAARRSLEAALRSRHITEDGRDAARQLLWGLPPGARRT